MMILTAKLWLVLHLADVAIILAAWIVIALPLVLAMDRVEMPGDE